MEEVTQHSRDCRVMYLKEYAMRFDRMNKEQNKRTEMDLSSRQYLRYKDAAAFYGVSVCTMRKLGMQAHAISKVGKLTLINIDQVNQYLEANKL